MPDPKPQPQQPKPQEKQPQKGLDQQRSSRTPDSEPPKEKRSDDL